MGCCQNNGDEREVLKAKIKVLVQAGSHKYFKEFVQRLKEKDSEFDLNSMRFKLDESLTINVLGLSLLAGHAEIFKFILNELQGDFESMELMFRSANTSGLFVICLNNYKDLLDFYLPMYFKHLKHENSPKLDITLNLDVSRTDSSVASCTPIQIACASGHISVMNYFLTFNKTLLLVPHEIDIHFPDPISGYNCALIASKHNNLSMIKFLHRTCQADFFLINHFNENAVNVLAVGSKEHSGDTLACLQYLIEVIGVDFLHNYQESLLMLEDERAVCYLETRLKTVGVTCKKIEILNELRMRNKSWEKVDVETGKKFCFLKMFSELDGEKDEKRSRVSSWGSVRYRGDLGEDLKRAGEILEFRKSKIENLED